MRETQPKRETIDTDREGPTGRVAAPNTDESLLVRLRGVIRRKRKVTMGVGPIDEVMRVVNDANELAIVMGTSRVANPKNPQKAPFGAHIPAGLIGSITGLKKALEPDENGRHILTDVDKVFRGNEEVCLTGKLIPVAVPNGFCRVVGMHAESLDDPNAEFDSSAIEKLLTLDNPLALSIVKNELWRIALYLAGEEIMGARGDTENPCEKGQGLLNRAIKDGTFRSNVLQTMQTVIDDMGGDEYSFRHGSSLCTADDQSAIWSNTLPDYKQVIGGTNVLWYQIADGACWAQLVNESDDTILLAHAGDANLFPDVGIDIKGVPHAWVRAAITAKNSNVYRNFDREKVRDRIIVTPALSNIAEAGGKITTRANFYNHPKEEGTGQSMRMAPAFPVDRLKDKVGRMFLCNEGLIRDKKIPHLYKDLRSRIIDPYLVERSRLGSKNDFAGELPRGTFTSPQVTALRNGINNNHSVNLSPHSALLLYIHIMKRVEDRAKQIFAQLDI